MDQLQLSAVVRHEPHRYCSSYRPLPIALPPQQSTALMSSDICQYSRCGRLRLADADDNLISHFCGQHACGYNRGESTHAQYTRCVLDLGHRGPHKIIPYHNNALHSQIAAPRQHTTYSSSVMRTTDTRITTAPREYKSCGEMAELTAPQLQLHDHAAAEIAAIQRRECGCLYSPILRLNFVALLLQGG